MAVAAALFIATLLYILYVALFWPSIYFLVMTGLSAFIAISALCVTNFFGFRLLQLLKSNPEASPLKTQMLRKIVVVIWITSFAFLIGVAGILVLTFWDSATGFFFYLVLVNVDLLILINTEIFFYQVIRTTPKDNVSARVDGTQNSFVLAEQRDLAA